MLDHINQIPCILVLGPASSHFEERALFKSFLNPLWEHYRSWKEAVMFSEIVVFSLWGGPENLSEEIIEIKYHEVQVLLLPLTLKK